MAIREIFQEDNDILLKRSREVTAFDDKLGQLLDDMLETLHKAEGAGLAGPQVGLLRRVAVVDTGEFFLEMINPQIIKADGAQIDTEGCLSVDASKNCEVLRPYKLTVRAFDRHGNQFEKEAEGYAARAICHELDHLEGILFYTRKYEGKPKKD